MATLPEPLGADYFQARAINSDGVIAGDAQYPNYENIVYRLSTAGFDHVGRLGTGLTAIAAGINAQGWIVGSSEITPELFSPVHAFLWDGALIDLGVLAGRHSDAWDINDAGTVVGQSQALNSQGALVSRAVVWSGDNILNLPRLATHDASLAVAINNVGVIAGQSSIGPRYNDGPTAVLWRDGQIVQIGPLVPDAPWGYRFTTECIDMNDDEVVVGRGQTGFNSGAGFMWEAGTLTLLPALLPEDSPWDPYPAAINNAGQIACHAFHRWDPAIHHALILTPPECRGFPRGDANCDGTINNFDIDAFVMSLADVDAYATNFAACNWLCNLDINRDGSVNNFDIDPFVELLVSQP
ncbi:MAG: hypothetical protein AB7Q17_14985 [Phycisphaerae bacterium]